MVVCTMYHQCSECSMKEKRINAMVVCTMYHQCSECSMKEKQCHGSLYNVSPVL